MAKNQAMADAFQRLGTEIFDSQEKLDNSSSRHFVVVLSNCAGKVCFMSLQVPDRPWTLFSGTLWGRTSLRWQWRVSSSLFSPYYCNTTSLFASGQNHFGFFLVLLAGFILGTYCVREFGETFFFFFFFRPWWFEPEIPTLGPEDEDVARERERVKGGKAQTDILTMIDLSKVQLTSKQSECSLRYESLFFLLGQRVLNFSDLQSRQEAGSGSSLFGDPSWRGDTNI